MIRRDFFELVEYAIDRGIGVKFSTNGAFIDRRRGPPAGGHGLPRHPDQPRRPRRRHQRRRPRRRLLRHGPAGDGPPGRGRLRAVQDLDRRHPPQRRPARRVQGAGRLATAPSCASPGCARPGRGADTWHELHPTNEQQRQIYRWLLAHGDNVLTGDSFFHLNALGEPLPGLEHVRRRAGGVPDRPDRRRLRLPVRDPRRVPGRQRPRRRAASPRCGATSELFRSLREPQSAGACASLRQLRRLPGRLHGGQVLHRPAARRPRPGVRARPRPGTSWTSCGPAPAPPCRGPRATTRSRSRSSARP